ncbi:hypothetical protein PIB30_105498, partial [Stylosanthes scabra]|nr:hypothetical protein [Stylosanthes scabra]
MYGDEIGWQMFSIDDSDNCLEFNLVDKGRKMALTKETFEKIRTFYSTGRGVKLQLRYVGFRIFYLTLLNRSNEQLATSPIPELYIARVLTPTTISQIESAFNLKYEKLNLASESPGHYHIAVASDLSEPMNSKEQVISCKHSKTLTDTDAYGSDLYIPADFREELEFYGINRIWIVIGPPNPRGNIFHFMLRNSRERPGEFRFGLEWSTCC